MDTNINNSQNRVMIAAPGSGCGKTTITCAILYGLKLFGERVAALKCGPDYIDPLFHRSVLGIETGNLDMFLTDIDRLKEDLIYYCDKNDITIIEGAMGYFDGIGMTDRASAYDIARKTETPVILIINGAGMALSIMAILDGFLANDKAGCIKGVIINNTTEKIWNYAKSEINKRGIAPIGWVPRLKDQNLKSRHLGLITPEEVPNFDKIIRDIFKQIRETIDWSDLRNIASKAALISAKAEGNDRKNKQRIKDNISFETVCKNQKDSIVNSNITIAIARDQAFCFYYSENIRMLVEYGCNIEYFSPLKDTKLPDKADGLILWGGYPECYANELAENKAMLQSIYNKITNGMPTIAECGGYLYLQRSLEGQKMVGIFDQDAVKENKLRHFGYVDMKANSGISLFNKEGMKLRAHEFHYCHMEDEGSDFTITKASGSEQWTGCVANEQMYAGFPHILFPGNVDILESFLEKCIQSRTCVRKPLQYTR